MHYVYELFVRKLLFLNHYIAGIIFWSLKTERQHNFFTENTTSNPFMVNNVEKMLKVKVNTLKLYEQLVMHMQNSQNIIDLDTKHR